jgi:hypothetical protein
MTVIKTIGSFFLLLGLVLLTFACGGSEKISTPVNAMANAAAGGDLHLNVEDRAVSQPISRDLRSPQNYAFVEVEVAKVMNPKQYPVRFEVRYDPGDGSIFFGTFSLFPADNPGTFLVPTQGKLTNTGKLTLSLILPEDTPKDAELEIIVRPLRLKEK